MVIDHEVAEKQLLRAVSHPIRRDILRSLAERGMPITARNITKKYLEEISQPAVSRHLKILVQAGLVRRGRLGNTIIYRVNALPLKRLHKIAKSLLEIKYK